MLAKERRWPGPYPRGLVSGRGALQGAKACVRGRGTVSGALL